MTLITITSSCSNFNGLHFSQYEYAYTGAYHQPVIFLSGTNHGAQNMTGSVRIRYHYGALVQLLLQRKSNKYYIF
jgi:hypothetical protein